MKKLLIEHPHILFNMQVLSNTPSLELLRLTVNRKYQAYHQFIFERLKQTNRGVRSFIHIDIFKYSIRSKVNNNIKHV